MTIFFAIEADRLVRDARLAPPLDKIGKEPSVLSGGIVPPDAPHDRAQLELYDAAAERADRRLREG